MSTDAAVSKAGTKGVPRPEREQQILDAATDVFGAAGFARATVADVARRSGVSKPLVLNYFGSKEGLYVACAERAGANLVEHVEDVMARHDVPVDLASAALVAVFAALEPRPHDWNVLNDRTAPDGPPSDAARRHRRAIAEHSARGAALLADVAGLDADDASILTDIWMNTVTAMVHWWLRHPDRSATEMSDRARRIVAVVGNRYPGEAP
ncbi:TetR/AcrR family transcriptional regulator [Gordonia sp. CPCC 206044]|uniref:TetR/AcrR family transcriptional regulator n=1 Tax=Gordonia sp. CPCC 206044 TaxID=3140793 RepID=UPI003AF35222